MATPGPIHFRTRGGPTQGWGNVYRIAAFARRCLAEGRGPVRILAEGPPEVIGHLRGEGFEVVALRDGIAPDEEAGVLAGLPRAAVTIVELLECRREIQALHKARCDRLVVFDDLLDQTYCADMVFCGQDLPGQGNRDLSEAYTRFFVGYEYFMFSERMRAAAAAPDRPHRQRVERVLVAFGGGRYDIAYLKAAAALADWRPDVGAVVVLGPAADPRLAERLRDRLPKAEILAGVDRMEVLLRDCDLALVGAGYLKMEAALLGTPMIMVATQWHQIPLAETFAARTGTPNMGYAGFLAIRDLSARLEGLADAGTRRDLARRAQAVVDGRGGERVGDLVFGSAARGG